MSVITDWETDAELRKVILELLNEIRQHNADYDYVTPLEVIERAKSVLEKK